ncbi:MAG TPA: hypothetical protein VK509_20040 [Polyangiales bacterium]|nr:hypothetical protein [Polyangiales bacterium]
MSDEREPLAKIRADAREAALDRALASLPEPEVDALWSRATRVAAQRRLGGGPVMARLARYEPALLVLLSAAQLIWAALRVFAFAR